MLVCVCVCVCVCVYWTNMLVCVQDMGRAVLRSDSSAGYRVWPEIFFIMLQARRTTSPHTHTHIHT